VVVCSILSGNRNFEGRIHPDVRMNFLASPPLVVAYALAGVMDIDMDRDPLAHDASGNPVRLRDLWPTQVEVGETIARCVDAQMFRNISGPTASRTRAAPAWSATTRPGCRSVCARDGCPGAAGRPTPH